MTAEDVMREALGAGWGRHGASDARELPEAASDGAPKVRGAGSQVEAVSEALSECRVPWWLGLTCDHLYEDCPNRQRGLAELRKYDWDGQGRGLYDPHDPNDIDLCGMCRYRHNRKHHGARSGAGREK